MSNQNDRLPDEWVLARIADVVDHLQYGYTAKASNTVSGPKFLRITDIKQNGVDWVSVPTCEISSHDFETYRLYPGDIVFARTGSIEKAWRVENPPAAIFASYLIRGRPTEIAIGDWLAKFVQSGDYLKQVSAVGAGIGRENVNARNLGQISFPLPPLAEQRRIVAKIEALQERSRQVREALAEVGQLLEQFRQSVLAAVLRGDLTANWRATHPNVEPARELLHRIHDERHRRWEQAELARYEAQDQKPPKNLRDRYKEPEPVDDSTLPNLPNGWEWVRVKDLGEVQLGRQRAPQYHSGPNMRPYLRVMNVFEDRIDTADIMEMDFSPEEFERYRLEPGDILLNEGQSRELVGRSAIYHGEMPGACFTNTLVRFRPDAPIESDYPQIVFLGYLKTGRFQQLAALTVNIAHLGAGRFADMEFPLPPLEEQAEIVRRARGALDQITRLEERLHANCADLDQLDQSILAKAFRGELVPQDPNDEPASVLLARIREQKAQRAEAARRSKKTVQPQRGNKTGKKSSNLTPQQLTLAEVL